MTTRMPVNSINQLKRSPRKVCLARTSTWWKETARTAMYAIRMNVPTDASCANGDRPGRLLISTMAPNMEPTPIAMIMTGWKLRRSPYQP